VVFATLLILITIGVCRILAKNRITLFLILSVIIYLVSSQPSLLWPEKWRTARNRVNLGTPGRPLTDFATYYIDATMNVLRMDEEYCTMSNKLVGTCIWYFLNHNIYLNVPTQTLCCLAVPNLGPTPPDWIQKLNHTYLGLDTYVGEPAYKTNFTDGDGVVHTYYQRVSDPRFPFAMVGNMENVYDVLEFFSSEIVANFSSDLFQLPPACTAACPMDVLEKKPLPKEITFFLSAK